MSDIVPAAAPEVGAAPPRRRRRPLWRRLLRMLVWTTVLLIVLAGIGYFRATRPDRLRAQFLKVFGNLRHADIAIGDIQFSPWDGLDVVDLQITLEPHAPLIAGWHAPRTPPMLRVAHLNVQLDLPALFAGVTKPTAIRAAGATLTVVRDSVTGRTNWNFGPSREARDSDSDPSAFPVLRFENADIQLYTAERGAIRLIRRWIVKAAGDSETRGDRPGYGVRIDQIGGPSEFNAAPFPPAGELVSPAAVTPKPAGGGTPLATVWLGRGGRTLESSLGWIDLTALDALLPTDLADRKRDVQLRGRAMVEALRVRDGRLVAAEIRLNDMSFVLPVEPETPGGPPAPRFLKFDGFNGSLLLERDVTERDFAAAEPARIRIAADGRMGTAACKLVVSANGALGGALIAQPLAAAPTSQPASFLAGGAATRPSVGDEVLGELAAVRNWPFEGELTIDGFELPTAAAQPEFVQSPNLPKALRAFFKDFLPHGKLDVTLRAMRDAGSLGVTASPPPIRVEGDFVARGTSLRYYRFPYQIDDAEGFFRYRDGAVLFDGLSGRHGSGSIRVDGRLAHTRGHAALDLTISGHGIALDADLYAALPERYKHLWESAAPIGLSDILATLHRDEGSPETGAPEVTVRVDARLLSASLSAGSGQRLRQADGTITIDRGIVTLHDLYGTLDGASVRLSGTIDGNRKGAADANNLHLEASNVRIERTATIHAGDDTPPDQLRFVGHGDVSGRIRGAGGMLTRDAQYVVQISGGELDSFDAGPPWQCNPGMVIMRGEQQEIRSLSGHLGGAWFEGSGTLPTTSSGGPPINLEVRAGTDDMHTLIPRIVPTRWRKYAETLGLSGAGNATIRIAPATDQASGPSQRAELRVEAAACRLAPVPLPLHDFRASATVDAAGFVVPQATGRYGEKGIVRLSGRGGWDAQRNSVELKVEATDMPLGPEFSSAMPAALSRVLKRLAPTGLVTIRLDQLKLSTAPSPTWDVRGDLTFGNVAMDLGLPLTGCDGELSGECNVRADGEVDLAAGFTIHRGQLARRPLERTEGQLIRTAGERWIQLNDLHGRLCDGEASGFARIDPTTTEYEVALTLQDVRLDQFLPGDDADIPLVENAPASAEPGRVDGRVFLRGRSGDDASRRGGGELRIRGASFLGTPVLKNVVEARGDKGNAPAESAESIELRFVWEGSDLKFQRVELHSRDLRLVGEGRWNMDSDVLVMTLVGAHPRNWPRVAVLSDLIESAGQELMQYRVSGTKKSPKVTAEPLHNLTEPIRQLIEGR